jgi:cobalt-precorrin 5A hydrolase
MEDPEAMIAAGFGCRAGCTVEHVLAALAHSLEATGHSIEDVQALYTADFKASEPGLIQAAQRLDKSLVPLDVRILKQHSQSALTTSPRVLARFGVPSVAETAALAGASLQGTSARARLLGPRRTWGDATCALASAEDGATRRIETAEAGA